MAARRRAILKSASGCFSRHSAPVSLLAAYSALSVNRHRQMRSTGYDIGIFEQSIRS
ncbi:hypothetical protein [Actinomadura sp. NEAU-AAG7]|uniref:hypothetical protein n=1 Tax=Actinomadura sp. NEAU-AAG7 TaxID=2839640 RepID=UPI001BE3F52B|nr:hypothetical protein [Actinomadura sp. NEAU-AAG7]MBT2212057.1 hypothetical protein [Actinomadura sp. NEAU-AAG7]